MAGSLDFYANLDPNSVANHAFGSGAEILGSNGGYTYSRVAKADGGYDYYRGYQADNNTAPDIRSIGEADVAAGLGVASDTGGSILGDATNRVSGGTSDGSAYTPEDIAYLQGVKNDYLDQQGRLGTAQEQGMKKVTDEYGREVNAAEVGKTNKLNEYGGQRTDQTTTKGENYSKINNAANKGYTGLAAILGRASGTGSSAFQKVLPNVIGKDVYGKRSEANTVFGKNMQNIDSSQTNYLTSFAQVLDDLKRQRDDNESNLLSGINSSRATIASKLGTVEGQLAAANGGGVAQIRAAQAPYDTQVRESRDAIDGLFNKYFRPYTPKVADAPAPELGNYTMDRSLINAGGQQGVDPTNPYSSLLRKKLQEQTI